MNKSVVHIVLLVLAVLAGAYGVYMGVLAHNVGVGSFYDLTAIMFGAATKVL
jgi:hypothetical protein